MAGTRLFTERTDYWIGFPQNAESNITTWRRRFLYAVRKLRTDFGCRAQLSINNGGLTHRARTAGFHLMAGYVPADVDA
jgi:hypothetical protein